MLADLNISQRPFQTPLLCGKQSLQTWSSYWKLGGSLVIGLGCAFMCSSFSRGSSCFVSLIACLIFLPVKAMRAAEGVRMDGKCRSVLRKMCLFSEYDQVQYAYRL